MIQLRDYQKQGIDQLAALAKTGTRRIIFQAATGSGKTVTFSALSDRFLQAIGKRVVIAVHRDELLHQTVKALKNVAGITAGMLMADHKLIVQKLDNGLMIPHTAAKVVVCMVETLHKRISKYEALLGDVGMLIVDECHRGEFRKLYERFPKSLIVGFSATPISANKRDPLKNHFDDIVTPISIQRLIDEGYLAKNITMAIKGAVSQKDLKVRGDDFDAKIMGDIYSRKKHVENCVKQYEKYALGEKTLVFNCNIEHSKKVTDAFVEKGYNARHVDGTMDIEERKATLKWFAETFDAILCSVDILNTGFDEPTIQNAIINRATKSLVLWIQMAGRGARRIAGQKDSFKIIDLGSNVATHADWNFPHNWRHYFFHPEQAGKRGGSPPMKECINSECGALIHLSQKICNYCLTDNSKPPRYDTIDIDLEVLTKGIDIDKLIEKNRAYKKYASLHQAKRELIARFRNHYKNPGCDQSVRDRLNERYQVIVKDWCKSHEIKYNKWHKETTKNWLFAELNRYYGIIEDVPVIA